MKITVYTTPDCTFSAAEKTYLQGRNLPFEEKNVKNGEAILTEMLQVGNNFAGTPVTKIVKDDGTEVVLKGFTQSEFEEALAPKKDAAPAQAPAAPVTPPAMPTENKPVTPPVGMPEPSPMAPAAPSMPPVESAMPPVSTPEPMAPTAPTAPVGAPVAPTAPAEVNPLDSILRDLQNKVAQESAAAGTPAAAPAASAQSGTLPSVPDFGAK